MKTISFLVLFFIVEASSGFAQSTDLPSWMKKSGWVEFYEVCESMNELNGTKNDCSEGNMVTEKETLFNAIYWAGEVTELYYSKTKSEFTRLKIKVKWRVPRGDYYCGQILTRKPEDVKDFTKTSLSLRKCD